MGVPGVVLRAPMPLVGVLALPSAGYAKAFYPCLGASRRKRDGLVLCPFCILTPQHWYIP